MRNAHRVAPLALLLAAGVAAGTSAQAPAVKIKEEKPGMLKQAKVSADSATRMAQAKYPNGTIKSGELEMEKGKLIYSFDIQQPGMKGIEEVNIDAATGALTAEHEDPAPPKPKKPAPTPPLKKPPVS